MPFLDIKTISGYLPCSVTPCAFQNIKYLHKNIYRTSFSESCTFSTSLGNRQVDSPKNGQDQKAPFR